MGHWRKLQALEYRALGGLVDTGPLEHFLRTDEPTYELYDAERYLSCWVHETPTPEEAATPLKERGEPPEEE